MAEPKKKVAKKFNPISISFTKPLLIESANLSSVDLKRNAKGTTEFSVKVYGSNAISAAEEAKKVYDELNKEYPNG